MIQAEMRNKLEQNNYNLYKYTKLLSISVINHLVRNFSICNSHNQIISSLGEHEYHNLFKLVSVPSLDVRVFVEKFLRKVIDFQKFLRTCKFTSRHSPKGRYRFVRLYLHKLHRIAPVFDYERAKQNLEILHTHLDTRQFWPQFTTQIAVVIYVTDKNDKNRKYPKKLLQKNIRVLCSCSAYAFHRTRKKMRIV